MRSRLLAVAVLAAAILLAGCATPGQGQDGNDTNNTTTSTTTDLSITAEMGSPELYEGGSTELVLSIANDGTRPVEDLEAVIANRGDLDFTRQIPRDEPNATDPAWSCSYDTIPPAVSERAVPRRCVWDIHTVLGMVEPGRGHVTYPLTLFIEYTAGVTSDRSLDVAFEPTSTVSPGDTQEASVRLRNKDISVTATVESPLPAEDAEVPVTLTVRNVGRGIFTSTDRQDAVDIRFTGTLADTEWDMQASTCDDAGEKTKTVYIEDGRATTISCIIALPDTALAGKTFFVAPEVRYRYRVTRDIPLRVVGRD